MRSTVKNTGYVVSITGNVLVMSPEDGSANVTRMVDVLASVTLNGEVAELVELERGDLVTCAGDPATFVTATR